MVLCFIALFVFGVMALFSARYRPLAREAFDCTLRKITLRPCASNLDERLKARSVAKLLRYSPRAARLLHKHFDLLSLAFTILFFVSLIYSALAVYNFYAFGNCNGYQSPEGCILSDLSGGRVVGAVNNSADYQYNCPPPHYSPYVPIGNLTGNTTVISRAT